MKEPSESLAEECVWIEGFKSNDKVFIIWLLAPVIQELTDCFMMGVLYDMEICGLAIPVTDWCSCEFWTSDSLLLAWLAESAISSSSWDFDSISNWQYFLVLMKILEFDWSYFWTDYQCCWLDLQEEFFNLFVLTSGGNPYNLKHFSITCPVFHKGDKLVDFPFELRFAFVFHMLFTNHSIRI